MSDQSEILLKTKWEQHMWHERILMKYKKMAKNFLLSSFSPFFSWGRIRINVACKWNYVCTHVQRKLDNIFNYISSNLCCRTTCIIWCWHRQYGILIARSAIIDDLLRATVIPMIYILVGWMEGRYYIFSRYHYRTPIMVVLLFDTLLEIIGL